MWFRIVKAIIGTLLLLAGGQLLLGLGLLCYMRPPSDYESMSPFNHYVIDGIAMLIAIGICLIGLVVIRGAIQGKKNHEE